MNQPILTLCVLDSSLSFPQLQGQEILRWQETIPVTTPTSSLAAAPSPAHPQQQAEQSAAASSALISVPAFFGPSPITTQSVESSLESWGVISP